MEPVESTLGLEHCLVALPLKPSFTVMVDAVTIKPTPCQ